VDVDVRDRDAEVADDVRPHVAVPLVVVCAETEAADHLEEGQVRAVADLVNVVRADAVLDIAVAGAVRRLEPWLEWLHPRADEKRGGVVLGDYVGAWFKGETVLAEVASNGLV